MAKHGSALSTNWLTHEQEWSCIMQKCATSKNLPIAQHTVEDQGQLFFCGMHQNGIYRA